MVQMQEKIIRLMPSEAQKRIKLLDFEIQNDELFVNIHRESEYEDINGYFLRSKTGAAVLVNTRLTAAKQAQVIRLVIQGIKKCPSSEFGVVDKDMKFTCGGHCCF